MYRAGAITGSFISSRISLSAGLTTSLIIGSSLVPAAFCQENQQESTPLLRPAIDTNKPVESVKTPLIKDSDSTATNTPLGKDKTPAPPSLEQLRALVKFTAQPLPVSRNEVDLVGIKILVQNNTDSTLMFDGDKAVLHIAGQNIPAALSVEKKTSMGKAFIKETNAAVVAGVTIGAYPTIRDIRNQKGPILERYGADEKRRENVADRFGKRVLWPGDISEGIVFVKATKEKQIAGAQVEMPVGTFPDMKLIGQVLTTAAESTTRISP